jgi:hypothetical protein
MNAGFAGWHSGKVQSTLFMIAATEQARNSSHQYNKQYRGGEAHATFSLYRSTFSFVAVFVRNENTAEYVYFFLPQIAVPVALKPVKMMVFFLASQSLSRST